MSPEHLVHLKWQFPAGQKRLAANPCSWMLRGVLHHQFIRRKRNKKSQVLNEAREFRNFHLSWNNTWPLCLGLVAGEEVGTGPRGQKGPMS